MRLLLFAFAVRSAQCTELAPLTGNTLLSGEPVDLAPQVLSSSIKIHRTNTRHLGVLTSNVTPGNMAVAEAIDGAT